MPAVLYLIPVTLGDVPVEQVIPEYVRDVINGLEHFIVENERSGRRFIKKAVINKAIDQLKFYLLNEHTPQQDLGELISVLLQGNSAGLLSEAGVPAVADPGSGLVALAHKNNIPVVPLVGPSSILLALMASGFNGQSFRFHGYLPVKQQSRIQAIRQMEKNMTQTGETQIFMETPYRNDSLFSDLTGSCHETSMLCIAADITLPAEEIVTRQISEWRKSKPRLHKRPAIFLLGRI